MNTLATILLSIAILSTTACVSETTDTDQPERNVPAIEIWEMPTTDDLDDVWTRPADHGSGWTQMDDPDGQLSDAICECTTEKCEDVWVTENFGCGVCVMVNCGDGATKGGCVSCDDELPVPEPLPMDQRDRINNELNEAI